MKLFGEGAVSYSGFVTDSSTQLFFVVTDREGNSDFNGAVRFAAHEAGRDTLTVSIFRGNAVFGIVDFRHGRVVTGPVFWIVTDASILSVYRALMKPCTFWDDPLL